LPLGHHIDNGRDLSFNNHWEDVIIKLAEAVVEGEDRRSPYAARPLRCKREHNVQIAQAIAEAKQEPNLPHKALRRNGLLLVAASSGATDAMIRQDSQSSSDTRPLLAASWLHLAAPARGVALSSSW